MLGPAVLMASPAWGSAALLPSVLALVRETMESLRHVRALKLQLQVRGGRVGTGWEGTGRSGRGAGQATAISHLPCEEPSCQGDEPWPF